MGRFSAAALGRRAGAVLAVLNVACLLPPALNSRTVGPPGDAAAVRRVIDSLVSQSEFRSAQWGVLVYDPATGDTLYSRNAGKLFLPASNMKLVTTAVALTKLGPDYRWVTTIAARGPITDGVLDGDLLVYGRGDPSVSDSVRGDAMFPLREMADSLYDAGLRHISGQLVVGADVFPGPTLGFGWSWDDLDDSDGAPVDELLFNDGFGVLHVRAGAAAGEVPTVVTSPARTYPALRIGAVTVAPGDTAALHAHPLRAVEDTTLQVYDVQGTIAAGDSATLVVPFPAPDQAYLAAFQEALEDRGITVEDRIVDTTAAVDSLFRFESPTLADILPAILKPSQNQMAEMLLRTIGLTQTGIGRADSAVRVESDQLQAWGAQPDGYVLHDGSGLARYDYLTPETVVDVLAAMRRSSDFDVFYDALPIAGVDGTLHDRMRDTDAQGNVHAKTGSLSNTRALSGYVTTADGQTLIFSLLCNNFTAPPDRVLAVEDAVAERLAALRVR